MDDSGREGVAIPEVTDLLGDGTSWIILIDGWISQQDTHLSFFGQRHVYGAHSTIKLLKNRSIPLCEGLSGVVPGLSYKVEGNGLAPDESVHHVLVSGISELHDDIVDGGGKPGVSNQRESERMRLLPPVAAVTDSNDGIGLKCIHDGSDRIDRESGRRLFLCPKAQAVLIAATTNTASRRVSRNQIFTNKSHLPDWWPL